MNAGGITTSLDNPVLAAYPWASSPWGSYANFLDDWHGFLEFVIPNGYLQDMLNHETDPAHGGTFESSAADLLNGCSIRKAP